MGVIDNLEALLARGQDNALVRYGLANEYLKLGKPEIAIGHLRRCVAHDPKYSAAWKLLGRALGEAGALHEALAAYQQGIAVAEAHGDVQAAREMGVFARRIKATLTKDGLGLESGS